MRTCVLWEGGDAGEALSNATTSIATASPPPRPFPLPPALAFTISSSLLPCTLLLLQAATATLPYYSPSVSLAGLVRRDTLSLLFSPSSSATCLRCLVLVSTHPHILGTMAAAQSPYGSPESTSASHYANINSNPSYPYPPHNHINARSFESDSSTERDSDSDKNAPHKCHVHAYG